MSKEETVNTLKEIENKFKKGLANRDEKLTKEAIGEGERYLLTITEEKTKGSMFYWLGNAYMDFYDTFQRNKDKSNIPSNKNLQKTKEYLRLAIVNLTGKNIFLEKQLWVNYGNCLDSLGRGIEALYAYEEALKIDPKFSMAMGNKAIASCYFARISRKYFGAIHVDAYQTIQSVINDKELIKIGGDSARLYFENYLKRIEGLVKDKTVLGKKIEHPHYDDSRFSSFEKFYVSFCVKNKLFLNFHIQEDDCEVAITDPIFINITTKIEDDIATNKLIRYINQIKEDFITARLLLVQSQIKRRDFTRISKRTTFIYPLDYSQTHIYNGLLKSAFKETYNILDKIAVFLNEYYNLGFKEDKIYFKKIWKICVKPEKKLVINPNLLGTKNISLYGLYDIFLDFESGIYKQLEETRHALTHRQLTIYESGIITIKKHAKFENIEYDEMVKQTIDLMKLVKAAIIYLVNAVTLEERKRYPKSEKIIPIITMDNSQLI